MRNRSRIGVAGLLFFWAAWMLFTGTSSATLPIQKKAKALGMPADNCLYCHNEKLPKKGAVTHNERGKWLIAQKQTRKAKEIDVAWLKDYPGEQAAATASSTGGTMHMKSESTVHKPGPDVKTKTEAVVGTVKEYEAGKKIKVTGPAGKDVSFDLDKAVTVNGAIAVGQRVTVEYTKSNDGKEHVTVLSLAPPVKK
ncbi:MAG TPA: hypothetical protein VF958_06295 [Thermoanaerobaculia bacterium]